MARWSNARGKGKGIAFLLEHLNDEDGECVRWPMSFDDHGYGILGYLGKVYKAPALMCEMVNGPRPTPKHHAAHKCGNTWCIHPKHVRWATPKENMADSVRLGAVRQKGEPSRKLTEEDVAKILAMRGTASYAVIGPMFGVKPKLIGKIYRGELWKGGKAGKTGFKPGDPRNVGHKKPRNKGLFVSAAS